MRDRRKCWVICKASEGIAAWKVPEVLKRGWLMRRGRNSPCESPPLFQYEVISAAFDMRTSAHPQGCDDVVTRGVTRYFSMDLWVSVLC